MRYYAISITNAQTGAPIAIGPFKTPPQFTSFVNGKTVPGALNVELDIPYAVNATPMGAAFVRIWGIGIQDVGFSANLNGARLRLSAGMAPGLPLANPKQAGLILDGIIQQAYGYWQGTEQHIDLVITAGGNVGSPSYQQNITFNWPANTGLSLAIEQALKVAFPSMALSININQNLVRSNTETAFFDSVDQFAQYLKTISQSTIKTTGYLGVQLSVTQTGFVVFDGTPSAEETPIQISFFDMIGQPTWISFGTITAKFVMRKDIELGSLIQMPPSNYLSMSGSYSNLRNQSQFTGRFRAILVRHVGNFRQKDANSWCTSIEAVTI